MNKDRGRKLAAVRRAYDVARQYAPESPPERFTGYVANVAAAIDAADTAAAGARVVPLRSHTTTVRRARQALVETLQVFRDVGLGMNFETPGTRYNLNTSGVTRWREETLLQGAGQILGVVEQHAAEFTANGAPPGRLRSAIETFRTALTQRTEARARQRSATEAFEVALSQCDRAVAQLHGVMRATYTTDSTVLAAWNAARKIGTGPARTEQAQQEHSQTKPQLQTTQRLAENTLIANTRVANAA